MHKRIFGIIVAAILLPAASVVSPAAAESATVVPVPGKPAAGDAGYGRIPATPLGEDFPIPGSVFREYVWTPGSDYGPVRKEEPSQYVSSLSATGGRAFWLPNGRNRVRLKDLAGARRAEVLAEVWHALEGLTAKTIRVNENPWIILTDPPIPDGRGAGTDLSSYLFHSYVRAAVPLGDLKEGSDLFKSNIFEFDAFSKRWPLYKIYGVTWRIHYGPEKPHAEAIIATPASGAVISDHPVFSLTAGGGDRPISRVDYIGCYEDFNYKGHGPKRDWQFRRTQGRLTHHIGSSTVPPFNVTWDTTWIPDQSEPMKFAAIVTDGDGYSYVTPLIEGVALRRTAHSVKLYTAYDVPPDYRGKNASSNKVDIPHDPRSGSAAQLFVSSWSGSQSNGLTVNGNRPPDPFGSLPHRHRLDLLDVPVAWLQQGVNVLGLNKYSAPQHGIEVMWPGLELKVRYERLLD